MHPPPAKLEQEAMMTQHWDPQTYGQHAAFVPGLASGVLEWLAAKPGEKILDLGCGDGQLTARIAATGANVIGVDASPQMVAAARERGVTAEVGQAESLPCASGSFDAVFSNAALHWVSDQDAMMAGVRRVLKPGGRFVAEMGGHGNIAAIRVAFAAVLQKHGFTNCEGDSNYYPTPEAYARRLERHGFLVKEMALIPRPTALGPGGMKAWITTFRRGVLDNLPEEVRDVVADETLKSAISVST